MDILRSGALAGPAAFGWLRGALDAVRAQGAPDPPPSTSPVEKYAPYGIAAAVVGSGMFAVTAGSLLSLFVAQHSSPPADSWAMEGTASVSARAASEMPAYVFDTRPLGSPGLPYSGVGDPDPAGIADAIGIDLSTLTGVLATTRPVSNTEAHIWLTGVDGLTERQLTFGPYHDTAAALSPDGEWIAFVRLTGAEGKPDIWKVRTSGGEPAPVTDDPNYASKMPTWHPSGATIAFARAPWVEGRALPYKDRVWSVSATGGTPRMIARDAGLSVLDPEYSPDGRSILVTAESERQQSAIRRIDLATGEAQELVSYAGGEHTPMLSPNGREIVFASARGTTIDIYRADVDGSNITQLTTGPDHINHSLPCWSPDGSKILWAVAWNGGQAVYVMNRDGSGKTRVNMDVRAEGQPSWGGARTVGSVAMR